MIFLIIVFGVPIVALIWALITSSVPYRFYDSTNIRQILNQYSGDRDTQVLRALSDGKIKPSQIRSYYNYGNCDALLWGVEEFGLIRQFADRGECEIITKHSGSDSSYLHKIELSIKRGKAVVTKHWHAV